MLRNSQNFSKVSTCLVISNLFSILNWFMASNVWTISNFLIFSLPSNYVYAHLYVEDLSQSRCPEGKLPSFLKVTKVVGNGVQYFDYNGTFLEPMDDNYLLSISIYTLKNTKWTKTYAFAQKLPFCKFLQGYMGFVWYDIERLSGVTPGTCPLTGIRKVENYKFDSKKLRFLSVPFGKVNISVDLTKKPNNQYVHCLDFLVNINHT